MRQERMLEYREFALRITLREWESGYMTNLDLIDLRTGVTFRQWWPVVHEAGARPFATEDEAVAAALRFGQDYIDAMPLPPKVAARSCLLQAPRNS